MIAAAILVISVVGLAQFFVAYCRSLIAAYKQVDLSEDAREVTGIEDHLVHGDDFRRLLQLVRLCPEAGDDAFEIGAVRLYFRLLTRLRSLGAVLSPRLTHWAEQERAGCAYFAAVALDRRIAHNRDLLAQQRSG